MFNLKPQATAVLEKWLGLYTEAPATSLPEGASPLSLNCDYDIADVHQRPGKESAYYFEDLFVERIAGFAQSVADGPNELPWSNPMNATKGIPGTYASVALTTPVAQVEGVGAFETSVSAVGTHTGTSEISTPSIDPGATPEFALLLWAGDDGTSFVVDSGWTTFSQAWGKNFSAPLSGGGQFTASGFTAWSLLMAAFELFGTDPISVIQPVTINSGGLVAGTYHATPSNPFTAGSTIVIFLQAAETQSGGPSFVGFDESGVNAYAPIGSVQNPAGDRPGLFAYAAHNVVAGSYRVGGTIATNCFGAAMIALELPGGFAGAPSVPKSEELQLLNFGFSIPSTQSVLGFEVEVTGKQTNLDPSCVLVAKLLTPIPGSPQFQFQLPSVEGTVTVGSPTENWGIILTPAVMNNPNSGFEIQAFSPSQACTFDISAIKIKVFLTPNPSPNMNYIKTFEEEDVFTYTLVLDSAGTMWREDVVNNPGALAAVYTGILPGSYAKSDTIDQREFIAISNLTMGTDIPYTYDGIDFTRCSQVGPGAAPNVAPGKAGSSIIRITQAGSHVLPTGPHDWTLVSDNPSDIGDFGRPATPGNILTIIANSGYTVPAEITPGTNIVLSGFPNVNGFRINNDPTGTAAPAFYTVIAVGQPIPGQQSYDAFSVTVNFTTFYNQETTGGCTFEATTATLTAGGQVPNLEVGGQLAISGTGGGPPAGYDGTWTVLSTPNASQFTVTATKLQSNIATYSYTLVSGTNPVAGQAVNVFQTLNGNGVFNVQNAIITSAAPGTFSIKIVGANIPSAGETGSGIVFGTIFTFDPQTIVGNKTGGTIATSGIFASGVRQVCYSYLTEDDYMTAPSPIVTVTIPEGTTSITVSGLLPGPANVKARVVHLTPANGGQFYNIPQPVLIQTITGNEVNSSTWVNDNTSTSVVLSFSDTVLAGAIEIDVEGNNLFENIELGSCTSFVAYSQRIFAIGEQNKVPNFLNWSFDGGIVVTQGTAGTGNAPGPNRTTPAGWTLDPTFGVGGSVVNSPIFGFAYQISNTTGSTQARYGMITQGAFQDEFQVPIIQSSTAYSARVTCSVPTGPTTGNLVIELFNPATGATIGFFDTPLATVGTTMSIFTGTLSGTMAPVPNGLLLRVWAQGILNGATIVVDRVEVFPTENPVLATQIKGSYQDNFEAFDAITGVIKATVQNQQPVKTAFVQLDNLYLVKSKSMLSTVDNGTGEPNTWQTKQVSNKCGTTSIYGVDWGEDWAVIAGEPGAYIFTGGQPTKFSSEIQKLWNWINWDAGQTLWVVNDVTNQRIMIGVPMKTLMSVRGVMTQNPWIPQGVIPDAASPTTPNIVLMMNYSQINTGDSVADRSSVHSSSFTGKMLATDFTRKWSVWSIATPCAAYVTRQDSSHQLFIGNNAFTGKVYQLVEDLMEDDGQIIDQRYVTYPFISGEQAQQLQAAGLQKQYIFGRANIDFTGPMRMIVYPNTFPDSPYMHALLPDFAAPPPGGGNLEFPLHETAERLFVEFRCNKIGTAFALSELALAVRTHAFIPVRGRN